MSERLQQVGWRLALLVVLAVAGAITLDVGELRLDDPDAAPSDALRTALDALPDDSLVLVGFDPDVGTYAEVRATVRTLLADLVARDARLAFVSLTPEGRALALAEMARMARAGAPDALDVGFIPGAEAALVQLANAMDGARPLAGPSGDVELEAVALAVVVGGNDMGPRSWVEQVGPRTDVPMVAVTPSVLLPEVEPYRASGQLAALIATPRQGVTYRASIDLGATAALGDATGPSPLATLVGLVAAIGYLGVRGGGRLGAARRRDRA